MRAHATLRRLLRHLHVGKRAGRAAFGAATLAAVEAAIAAGEASHCAEIQLIVEAHLPLAQVLRGVHPRARAAELFSHYRLWDTETNCAILIYIGLADRRVEIVADRGVAGVLSKDEWHALCATMTAGFRHGAYADSTLAALAQLNGLLEQRLPRSEAARNELTNQSRLL